MNTRVTTKSSAWSSLQAQIRNVGCDCSIFLTSSGGGFSTACGNRFTHANRHCPKHPFSRLKREEPKEGQGKAQSVDNKAVAEWLAK